MMQNLGEIQQGTFSNQMQGEGFSDLLMLMLGQIGPFKAGSGPSEEPLVGKLLTGFSEDNLESMQEAGLQANFGMYGMAFPQAIRVAEVSATAVAETSSVPTAVKEIFNNQPIDAVQEELPPTPGKQPSMEMCQMTTPLLMSDKGMAEATESAPNTSMVKKDSSATDSQSQGIIQPTLTAPEQEKLEESSIKNLQYQQLTPQQTGSNLKGAQIQQAILYQPNLTTVTDQADRNNQSLEQTLSASPVLQPEEQGKQRIFLGVTKAEGIQESRQNTGLSALQSVQVANVESVISKPSQPTQTINSLKPQPEGMLTNASAEGQLNLSKTGLDQQGNKEGMQQERSFQNNQEAMLQHSAKSADQPAQPSLKEMPVNQLPGKMAEMVRAMLVQQNAGQTTVRMKLQPEQLGEVTVKLTWSKGELSAQFITSSGLAREALESSFPQLKELLAQQNIRLSEAAVFMGQQSGQWEQRSFSDGQQWQGMKQSKGKAQYTGISTAAESVVHEPLNYNNDAGVNLVV